VARVEVRLFGHLRDRLISSERAGSVVDVPEGSCLRELLERLGIPLYEPKIMLVNGVHALPELILAEGDRVSIFPPIAGG
jgi:sulfur-carrier protein